MGSKPVTEAEMFLLRLLLTSNTAASQSGHPSDYNPYLRFASNPYIFEFGEAVIRSTAADFPAVELYDSTNQVVGNGCATRFDGEFLELL